ncbi:Non-structural maintenance of chromosomes element 4 A [Hirschfeldia incana]|nr:Non-structural maintenance of chromosomes element 4 A [Hirschfeldia incana]
MRRKVKRESEASGEGSGGRGDVDESVRVKSTKKEKPENNNGGIDDDSVPIDDEPPTQEQEQGISDRRILRSQYLSLIHKISDSKDDLTRVDSDKFSRIFSEFENLHQKVQKPREQVADAEAFLDIANTIMSSVKSHSATTGVSPAEFVNALVNTFGQASLGVDDTAPPVSMKWKDLGLAVCSTVFVSCGCSTMLGPMDTELKERKRAVYRKRTKPGEGVRPDEVDDTQSEEKTDTDKNMAIMFNILGQKKRVRLENLVLNRRSFAQTVENLFALSFLAKDGRVEIIVDKNGSHFALPRNAPAANLVMSGEVIYNHFVFRFDFKDWKLMSEMVPMGEELMPHREAAIASSSGPSASADFPQDSQTTPIRKFSRNRGLVVQEDTVVDDSPDIEGDGTRKRIKRRLA